MAREVRILVLAPTGRDGELTTAILREGGFEAEPCPTPARFVEALRGGAAAAVIAEEALVAPEFAEVERLLRTQPLWSDLPLVILSAAPSSRARLRLLVERLGNVTLLDRPVQIAALLSVVQVAVRARSRQYAARDLLEALAQREADLRATDRAKDEFLATLSHELRTPLTSILGWTQMLLTGRHGDGRLHHGLEVIERNAQMQAKLVDDLLDVSRTVSGKLTMDFRPTDLGALLSSSVEAFRPTAEAKKVTLTLELETGGALRVLGDGARLQQALWNLLANAVKFTPPGGSIHVRGGSQGGRARVEVRDTGEGIVPEFLPHVFDRFRQQNASTTRVHGGLGLGLAIVRYVVELHGGSVAVQSDGPGKGASFRIELPLVQADKGAAQGSAAIEPADLSVLRGARILLVDDQPDSREMVALALEDLGVEVHTTESVSTALQRLAELEPTLVVTDIGMPGEDGFSLLSRLRDQRRSIPVVALTAFSDASHRDRGLSMGFAGYIAKPVGPEDLARELSKVLARLGRPASAAVPPKEEGAQAKTAHSEPS